MLTLLEAHPMAFILVLLVCFLGIALCDLNPLGD